MGRRAPASPGVLVEALTVLAQTPAPHGAEAAAAAALVDWGRAAVGRLCWEVDRYGDGGANVVVTLAGDGDAPALLLASHLDTSLSGVDEEPITGRSDVPEPLRVDGDTVSGPGLGVARAPVAAALAGLNAAAERLADSSHRTVQLLLAGSGTHRSTLPAPLPPGPVRPSSGAGTSYHLVHRSRPDAAVVAKCGPPGLLAAEPGAAYLRLSVTGRMGAALAPASADPPGGVALHAAAVLTAVGRWRDQFVRVRRGRPDGLGGEAGLGALIAGRADKPDLLPARLDLRLYLVTVPSDDPVVLATELAVAVRGELVGTPLASCTVEAQAEVLHPAGVTPSDAPVVAVAHRAWRRHLPAPPVAVRDWTGSTDGVVLRLAGVDAVRLGPVSTPDSADPRRDRLSLTSLNAFGRIYADIAVELATE